MAISSRDRRALLIMGGVVVVALAVYFLFLAGGSKKTPTAQVGPNPSPSVTAPVTKPHAKRHPKPAPSILVFTGRDPFQPLAATVGTTSSSGLSPAPAPSVSPAGSPPPTPSGGSSTSVDGHSVVLIDIFSGSGLKAQVEVDGTVYTVSEGQTFAGTFKLVDIQGSCADFLHGDRSFTLCVTANK